MTEKLLSAAMGIAKVTRQMEAVVAVPRGGLARARVIKKKISLPAMRWLGDFDDPDDETKSATVPPG